MTNIAIIETAARTTTTARAISTMPTSSDGFDVLTKEDDSETLLEYVLVKLGKLLDPDDVNEEEELE